MATLQELLAQKAQLEQQIESQLREGKANALRQIQALAAEFGINGYDLARIGLGGVRPTSARGNLIPKAAKYRNSATGETWSGVGKRPHWLAKALEGGASLESFRVGGAPAPMTMPSAPVPAAAPATPIEALTAAAKDEKKEAPAPAAAKTEAPKTGEPKKAEAPASAKK